jgi:hypothetical protein
MSCRTATCATFSSMFDGDARSGWHCFTLFVLDTMFHSGNTRSLPVDDNWRTFYGDNLGSKEIR